MPSRPYPTFRTPHLRFWVFPEMRQGQHTGFSTTCGDVCVSVRVSPECARNPPILPLWDENSPDVTWTRSEEKPPRGVEGLRSGQGNSLLSVNAQSCQRGVRNVGSMVIFEPDSIPAECLKCIRVCEPLWYVTAVGCNQDSQTQP